MKYLVVFAVLALAFWIWRKNRDASANNSEQSKPVAQNSHKRSGMPQLMVTCASCGVHLPQAEAVNGARAAYCSEVHRRKEEA